MEIISNFINDFFSLYDSKDKYNFSINIDVIARRNQKDACDSNI